MTLLQERLSALSAARAEVNLGGITRGIEKESLRITPEGRLAQTLHSTALGSALAHPQITTDFSEALLEFITPPCNSSVDEALASLDRIHRFTYAQLDSQTEKEFLWVNSMPCALTGDADIPVAQYGSSNIGKMKTVYRLGLGHRYGRLMQAIAGIHYNFSMPDEFWQFLHHYQQSTQSLQDFKTQCYFDLIRNFRRYFWLLLYLFGAAPVVCRSFVAGRKHSLAPFNGDDHSLYVPYATSLRMGDLGYQSQAQQSLLINYNDAQSYISALCAAITQHYPDYTKIGIKDSAGNYQQLNDGILQIENEFYSTIRPKRTTQRGETALHALFERGVEYIEVRCIDLNPFLPLGIDAEQIHFLDTFLLFCLLSDSPASDHDEYRRIQENQQRIVYRGRDPALELLNANKSHRFDNWSRDILEQLSDVAQLLDEAYDSDAHVRSLARQREKIDNPQLTPSAQVLQVMHNNKQSFFGFAYEKAIQYAQYFREHALTDEATQYFRQLATDSLAEQQQIERADDLNFEQYLKQFYTQYQCGAC